MPRILRSWITESLQARSGQHLQRVGLPERGADRRPCRTGRGRLRRRTLLSSRRGRAHGLGGTGGHAKRFGAFGGDGRWVNGWTRHGRPRCECGCGKSGSSSLNTGWRCPCGRSWTAARPFEWEIRCATYCMSTSASFRTRSRLRGGRQTRRTGNRRTPLPFLSRKKRKQKKVDCGGAALLFFSRARQGVTQNGRFTYEPSVFRAGKRGKPSYLQDELSPQSLLFLMKRKRSLLII